MIENIVVFDGLVFSTDSIPMGTNKSFIWIQASVL
jgi:hypothetical protein